MSAKEIADAWYEQFSRFAGDLYPGRYTAEFCRILVEQWMEIKELKRAKPTLILAHNYLYPEFHEIADKLGDSLGLSLYVQSHGTPRVDFQSVAFMGQTAKIIVGDSTRVYISDYPEVLGCSLVFGTDYEWLLHWKKETGGVIVSYINSDPFTKSISEYIGTSGNFDKVILRAHEDYPGRKILIAPDRFLGYVMKAKAVKAGVPRELIDVYEHFKAPYRASCYVHENIPSDSIEIAMVENPEADVLIHPECGCAASCMLKIEKDEISDTRAFILSTEGMVNRARQSSAKLFIVATEKGMIYRLRKERPEKTFIPVSFNAECKYMKENTFEKLLCSLREDRVEIVLCDDCCDPQNPYRDERTIHIQRSIAQKAKIGIDRMLAIS